MQFVLRQLQKHAQDSDVPVVVALLDFSRAFNSIPKKLIVYQLRHIGCPMPLLNMVKEMNNGVEATVAGDDAPKFQTTRVVRQVIE